jgi:hypothetical protein
MFPDSMKITAYRTAKEVSVGAKRGFVVLAITALFIMADCSLSTGSIGVHETQGMNWKIYVDESIAGTVAAYSSSVIKNVSPGVHTVSGQTPPGYYVSERWVTVEAGQTAWTDF